MQRLGTVVGTAQGLVVVRSADDSVADPGTSVVDESLEEVGEVVEVFGPVDRPYLAVSPAGDRRVVSLLDAPVYAR